MFSTNGTVATRFTFESPVFLEGDNTEYAICLASWSTKYRSIHIKDWRI